MAATGEIHVFKDALIILGTAAVVAPVMPRLKVSPVLGYLAMGALLGPYGLGRWADQSLAVDWFTVNRLPVTDIVAEVLVTVRRDAPIGWLVTLGHGGVTTELGSNVTHLLAPVTADDVRTALDRLRSAPLLHGFRGRPAADIDALADIVVRLTDAVVGTDVVEVELNPVLVGTTGATAVDALLIVEQH